jgi:hypothetical protein
MTCESRVPVLQGGSAQSGRVGGLPEYAFSLLLNPNQRYRATVRKNSRWINIEHMESRVNRKRNSGSATNLITF